MQHGPTPNAAAEEQCASYQPDGGPTNQRGATVRLIHKMHNFASLQTGGVNVILQTALHLRRRFLHFLRQHTSRAPLHFLHGRVKFRDRCANLPMDRLHGVVKNEPVHGDQGDCWIAWPEKNIVPSSDLRDEPLYVDGIPFVGHRCHVIASLSSCSKISRRTISSRCFETREKSAFWIASSNVNRRSSICRTSSP